MDMNVANSLAFARSVYRNWKLDRDYTLDNAKLETRCPLDNGRHKRKKLSNRIVKVNNHLYKLPVELLVEVLLLLDIPSLTQFRIVDRRAMELVNSVHQYSAIIKHCPNVIRAIVSLQADAFDCRTLYETLSTSRCSTCDFFGNYLYIVDCRRVCYLCFTWHVEYFPLTAHEISKLINPDPNSPRKMSSRMFLNSANPPSIRSLPGQYGSEGKFRAKRLRLYDRSIVFQNLPGSNLAIRQSESKDRYETEPKRFMAIISAPVLLDAGREVEHGYFCVGCKGDFFGVEREDEGDDDEGDDEGDDDEGDDDQSDDDQWNNDNWDDDDEYNMHPKRKYTTEEMVQHLEQYGPVKRDRRFIRLGFYHSRNCRTKA